MTNGVMITLLNKITFAISIPSMKNQGGIDYALLSIILHQCINDYALYITLFSVQFTIQINKNKKII